MIRLIRDNVIRTDWNEGRIGVKKMSLSFSLHVDRSCKGYFWEERKYIKYSNSWSASCSKSHMGLVAEKMIELLMKMDEKKVLGKLNAVEIIGHGVFN